MALYHQKLFKNKPELLQNNVQIIACAGSGKTEFVSERIATMINNRIAKPEQIVAITFNDAAAEELKFRVRDKIKELIGRQPDIGDMYIGTIHAFAFKILQDFVPQYRGYDMLNEESRLAFAASLKWAGDLNIPALYNGLKKRGFNYNRYFTIGNSHFWENWTLSTFLNDVDFYREEGLNERYSDSTTFKAALKVYFDRLSERRFLDFSGILRIAVDHLKSDKYILKTVRKQYNFFTIDEYQDVNPIQEELIKLVSGQKNVCVVGDDDQSIYQWRGANVENMLRFEKDYKKYAPVTVYSLNRNLRSCDKIVKCASDFIEGNNKTKKRLKKSILPNDSKTEDGDLYKICFPFQTEEVNWIAEKIQHLIGKEYIDKGENRKIRLSDIAILFRRRSDAHIYKEALDEAGLGVLYSGLGGLMESDEIDGILRTITYIGDSVKVNSQGPNESLQDIFYTISSVFSISWKNYSKLVNEIINWCNEQKRLSLQRMYVMLLNGLGLSDISFHDLPDDETLLYNLGRFSQAISDFEGSRTFLSKNNIVDFVDFIRTHVSNSYDEGATDSNSGLVDAVQIMTMHGTKGLGFPIVFMPSIKGNTTFSNDRVTFLNTKKIDFSRYSGSEADERRLYYVAMSRAKKFLFITTYDKKYDKKRARSTKIHEFFYEFNDKYFITESKADPTKRIPCNIDKLDSDTRFPTNYSELSYYLSCSYDYRLRFIYGFNPELVQQLGYGKQIHNLINIIHKEYERIKKVPTEKRIEELVNEHFYLRYAATKQSDTLKKSCLKSLQNYIKLGSSHFLRTVKTEQNFEMDFEEKALISGSIDLLQRTDGNENILEVIDFKTGKPKSNYEEKYNHQVVLYAIAAREALLKDINKAYLHYLDSETIKPVEIDITEDKIKKTRKKLNDAITGITNNSFPRNPEKGICTGCDWCNICPKK